MMHLFVFCTDIQYIYTPTNVRGSRLSFKEYMKVGEGFHSLQRVYTLPLVGVNRERKRKEQNSREVKSVDTE